MLHTHSSPLKREINMLFNSVSRAASIAVSCLGVIGGISTAGAAYIIDDFTVTETGVPWTETLFTETDFVKVEMMAAATDNVIGGKRVTTLTAVDLGIPGFDFVRGILAPSSGNFDYASTANARGTLSFFYDGVDPDFTADFSDKTEISIAFTQFDYANEATLPVTITLSDSNASASHSLSLGENELVLLFSLADFGGVNLEDIRSIQIDFEPGIGTDFRLAQFAVVPAPGALLLLGIGGFLGARRRRRVND